LPPADPGSFQENPTNRAFPTATRADSNRAPEVDDEPDVDGEPGVDGETWATVGAGAGVRVSWTVLTVPGWVLWVPSEGWAALKRVRATAEAAPAARVRAASERRDRNSTSILQEERRCSGWSSAARGQI
jgi:hypothetical protein